MDRYIITYYKGSDPSLQTTVTGIDALEVMLKVLLSTGYTITDIA